MDGLNKSFELLNCFKEKRLLDVLEKINYPTPSTVKRSGDVRMWCYIETRTCKQNFIVLVNEVFFLTKKPYLES